jgi:hypothetical protein
MVTTLGHLIADLYDSFEEQSHDPRLAAIATAATVNELLCQVARRGGPARRRDERREWDSHAAV